MERKEFILQEIKNDPTDPMNHYFLAMEYKKEGENTLVIQTFKKLLIKFPHYIPTYYTYADYLISLEKLLEAQDVIEKGIKITQNDINQKKAHRELAQLFEIYFS